VATVFAFLHGRVNALKKRDFGGKNQGASGSADRRECLLAMDLWRRGGRRLAGNFVYLQADCVLSNKSPFGK
jgi:hypothetical protein